jgi:hypothetical protein
VTDGRALAQCLADLKQGLGDEHSFDRPTAEALGVEVIEALDGRVACREFVQRIPISFARQHHLLGLASSNGCLPVAVANLDDLTALDVVSRRLGKPVRPVLIRGGDATTVGHSRAWQNVVNSTNRPKTDFR